MIMGRTLNLLAYNNALFDYNGVAVRKRALISVDAAPPITKWVRIRVYNDHLNTRILQGQGRRQAPRSGRRPLTAADSLHKVSSGSYAVAS